MIEILNFHADRINLCSTSERKDKSLEEGAHLTTGKGFKSPVLSKILHEFEVEGSVYFCEVMSPPWSLDFTKKRFASFHCVRSGKCRLIMNGDTHELKPGDVAVILNADAHFLVGETQSGSIRPEPETLLICGSFKFRQDFSHPLFDALPPLLILRDEEIAKNAWLRANLDYLVHETELSNPGAPHVLNRMTEVLLVQFFRHHITLEGTSSAFLSALYDKQISKTLQLLHDTPETHWTIERLAKELAMSRASLASRFTKLVGMPLFTYLTDLRMRLAAKLLGKTELSVAEVSEKVGYASDAAFNRAFKRFSGHSALSYRRKISVKPE